MSVDDAKLDAWLAQWPAYIPAAGQWMERARRAEAEVARLNGIIAGMREEIEQIRKIAEA